MRKKARFRVGSVPEALLGIDSSEDVIEAVEPVGDPSSYRWRPAQALMW
jgi:hypothetical protein